MKLTAEMQPSPTKSETEEAPAHDGAPRRLAQKMEIQRLEEEIQTPRMENSALTPTLSRDALSVPKPNRGRGAR